jgi:DNA repair exonuclease SbcCD ATPase subunit
MPEDNQTNKQLQEQLEALKQINDKILQGFEANRQSYEASQRTIVESFKQIVEGKNKELEQKSYEIQDLKERVRDLEKDYGKLIGDYNSLDGTKTEESHKFKSIIEQHEATIKEQADKLDRINSYVSTQVNDAEIVNDLIAISSNQDTKQNITNTRSLLDDKEELERQLSQISQKIPVKEITIVRLEGPSVECDIEHKAYSFEEANKIIKEMSKSAPNEKEGGYDKVRFSVEFSDNIDNKPENIYTGRIDMMHYSVASNAREQNIPQHIHDHLSFYSGTLKPDHMSQQSYDEFLSKNTTEQSRQEINEFLEKYIPDEAKHPKVVAYELEQLKADAKSSELSSTQSTTKTKSASKEKEGGLCH